MTRILIKFLWARINIFHFLFLNIYVFCWGFLNMDSIYPLSEALIMSVLFIFIISFQLLTCHFLNNFGLILSLFFSCGNLVYFNLILNGNSLFLNFIYLSIFLILILFLNFINLTKVKVYFYILFSLTLIFNLYKMYYESSNKSKEFSSINQIYTRNHNKANFFFIGIDGMISSEMYFKLYNNKSPASEVLDSIGFSMHDVFSPGFGTLETYAKFFSYKKQIHTRESLKIINSENTPFFLETKNLGYKKQFNFYTNYFGGDPNNIFDSFYPKVKKPFSFVLYTDERWGWYSAYFIKYLFNFASDGFLNQFGMIYERINSIDLNSNYWISISHLWFPGHTVGSYNFNDIYDFNNFKSYYHDSQPELAVFFKNVVSLILKKDSKAVIVFYGDHGAYFFKGAESNSNFNGFNVNEELLLKDKKHVLLAIYPNDYLDSIELVSLKLYPEKMFKTILEKQK
jgi:hypothetical protein